MIFGCGRVGTAGDWGVGEGGRGDMLAEVLAEEEEEEYDSQGEECNP